MQRRRLQQVVIGFVVVGFVVATLGLVTDPGADRTSPTTAPAPDFDAAACDADVARITTRLADAFETSAGGERIADADWDEFFGGVAAHCAAPGDAISDVIVFAGGEIDAADDPTSALAPAITVAQLCGIDVVLTAEARSSCSSAQAVLGAATSTVEG